MFVFIKVEIFEIEKTMKYRLKEKSLVKENAFKMINDREVNLVKALQSVK